MNFEIDFNEFFNKEESCNAVTCITDEITISRKCYEGQYHADVMATMLTFLTDKPYTIKDVQFPNREDVFYMFIRYVNDKDTAFITIELPNKITDNMLSSLEELVNKWKEVKLEDKSKRIEFYLMDEGFNVEHNRDLLGIDISKADLMIDYLKKIKNNDKSK